MGALEALRADYEDEGLTVLGFYSNDFDQAGDPEACTEEYGVQFDVFQIDHVTNNDGPARPVFAWLAAQPQPGPYPNGFPDWNFHKYLLSRDGVLVGHWDSPDIPYPDDPNDPNDITSRIQQELAQ